MLGDNLGHSIAPIPFAVGLERLENLLGDDSIPHEVLRGYLTTTPCLAHVSECTAIFSPGPQSSLDSFLPSFLLFSFKINLKMTDDITAGGIFVNYEAEQGCVCTFTIPVWDFLELILVYHSSLM